MSIITDNISLVRANTSTSTFDSGVVNENTILAYANLFYPYILDDADNQLNVSLTIDVMNRDELEQDTKDLVNKQWVSSGRLANTLSNLKAIWGFKEAYHGVKTSRSISNAFCFGGQRLTFYIAPQGQETGYVDNSWFYCDTTITISATDVINGNTTILYTFDNFELDKDDATRYFNWTVPAINQEAFNNYGLFGMCVLSISVDRVYYEDAELTKKTAKILPSKNQAHLQLLIYSGSKEIIEVNGGDASVVVTTPSYNDTLEQIFSKTIFESLQGLNANPLTDAQKRAVVADQIAVLFMSQHPVLFADFYPSKIIGLGANQSEPYLKLVSKAITYGKRYPEIVPMVKDRLFGMLATYKDFNFGINIEKYITDYTQSTQVIKDPVRIIYIDSDGVVNPDFGVDGIAFSPYAVNVSSADQIVDVPYPTPIDLPLYDGVVDIQNFVVTHTNGDPLSPYTSEVKISYDVVFGASDIERIRYSIFTENSLNYDFYEESNVLSRSYIFDLKGVVVLDPSTAGDVVTAQIDIEDIYGGVSSFIDKQTVNGYADNPFIYDLKIYQRNDGSGVVDIYYTYEGVGELDDAYLYVQFSVDGGLHWSQVLTTSLKGDFGSSLMPGRRRITWVPSIDLGGSETSDPIYCRLTLYDQDGKTAYGDTLTGAIVLDLNSPKAAIMRRPIDNISRIVIGNDEIYTVLALYSVSYLSYVGRSGTTATVVLDGESFVIGNVSGYFVWDIDGTNEHRFLFEGDYINVVVNNKIYYVTYNGVGSLLFTISYEDNLSSSSSSDSSSSSSSI